MITLSPIPRAGLLVVHHPTDAGKVRQWTGTGAPQWVDLATATFAECAVSLTQIGETGIYHATLDLPDDATYPILLYGTDATAFTDQVIAQMTWHPEVATSAQATAIQARTDNLPDEPASKDDVQVTVEGGGGTGTGDLPTVPPAITREGVGVDNAIVRVYLASDYAMGNFEVRGEAVTGPDGRVVAPLMLNAGSYKAVVWDAQSRRSQVFDLEVSA